MEGNQLFPVFIKLNTVHTVLIGAGPVGLEKLSALLTNSPEAGITVIGREVIPELLELVAGNEKVKVIQKEFEASDLIGADLIVVATNNVWMVFNLMKTGNN